MRRPAIATLSLHAARRRTLRAHARTNTSTTTRTGAGAGGQLRCGEAAPGAASSVVSDARARARARVGVVGIGIRRIGAHGERRLRVPRGGDRRRRDATRVPAHHPRAATRRGGTGARKVATDAVPVRVQRIVVLRGGRLRGRGDLRRVDRLREEVVHVVHIHIYLRHVKIHSAGVKGVGRGAESVQVYIRIGTERMVVVSVPGLLSRRRIRHIPQYLIQGELNRRPGHLEALIIPRIAPAHDGGVLAVR